MAQALFVDLGNGGGHVRIDPPPKSHSSVRLMITLPRQFDDNGNTLEQASCLDCYVSQEGATQLRDALSLALDQQIQKMVGIVP